MKKIENFLKKNKNKEVVAVQGLGFVGSVMSMVCSNALRGDYAVIGIDRDTKFGNKIIDKLNSGIFPVKAEDPSIDKLLGSAKLKGNFIATHDSSAFKYANVIIVDVNLDVDKKNSFNGKLVDYNVDLKPFKKAIKTIGAFCKENALILIETTVPPGTCKNIVKPIIFQCLKDRDLSTKKIKIGHSYERVMPGPDYVDSIRNFYRVYSGINQMSEVAVKDFLKTIIKTNKYPLTRLSNTNATEMAKVLENSYRAMNIAFMVEWSRFAETANVDLYSVINAIKLRPTHNNMMFPGIGVGGYCLTKDSLLASWSKKEIFEKGKPLLQSEHAVNINDQMPFFAYEYLKKNIDVKNKRVTLLGVSYRGDVGDTRSSPVEKLHTYLMEDQCKISCHDPYVDYWNEKNIHVESDVNKIINIPADIIIISAAHSMYKNDNFIKKIAKLEPILIYDTIGLLSEVNISNLSKYHSIKVLGRGDL